MTPVSPGSLTTGASAEVGMVRGHEQIASPGIRAATGLTGVRSSSRWDFEGNTTKEVKPSQYLNRGSLAGVTGVYV